jgi:hypothetical protein
MRIAKTIAPRNIDNHAATFAARAAPLASLEPSRLPTRADVATPTPNGIVFITCSVNKELVKAVSIRYDPWNLIEKSGIDFEELEASDPRRSHLLLNNASVDL